MLYAYLDETGQESKEWVFITGFIGNEEQWRSFLGAWEDGFSNSQRKHLHTSELRFRRQSERRLLEKLAPIAVNQGLQPLLGGVRVNDYEDIFQGHAFLEKLNAGYIIALTPLIVQLVRWIPEGERVELIFEQQDRYMGLIDFTFKNTLDHPEVKEKIAKWSFVPKGSTPLIEPADYFAYAMGQYKKDEKSIRSIWTRPIIESVDTVRAIGAVFERRVVRVFASILASSWDMETAYMPKTNEEFEKFREAVNQLIKVTHDELSQKLLEEKKRKRSKKSSASVRAKDDRA